MFVAVKVKVCSSKRVSHTSTPLCDNYLCHCSLPLPLISPFTVLSFILCSTFSHSISSSPSSYLLSSFFTPLHFLFISLPFLPHQYLLFTPLHCLFISLPSPYLLQHLSPPPSLLFPLLSIIIVPHSSLRTHHSASHRLLDPTGVENRM